MLMSTDYSFQMMYNNARFHGVGFGRKCVNEKTMKGLFMMAIRNSILNEICTNLIPRHRGREVSADQLLAWLNTSVPAMGMAVPALQLLQALISMRGFPCL
jgi:hypothetical protein